MSQSKKTSGRAKEQKEGLYSLEPRPYHKPDVKIKYIHIEPNHPPNVIKHTLTIIKNHRSNPSFNENSFRNQQHIMKIIFGIMNVV